MTVAIMQPYLFPYIGYWQLINAVDTFVIYDNIQFSKNGWFHRNNILLNGKSKLFTISIKKDSNYLNVSNRYLSDASEKNIIKLIAQIEQGYKKAPYYNTVFPIIKNILLFDEKNLFKYILNSIKIINKYLEIETKIVISSTININHNLKSQDKVIAINKALLSNYYINPIGGSQLYDMKVFNIENIKLNFLKSEIPKYKQFKNEFIPYLSIIDILMFNSKNQIQEMLNRYELV